MSRSLAPALVTAGDIMEFTSSSDPCDARGRTPFIERYLHGEIYRQRPDVMGIAHGHSPAVIPFGLTSTPMRATYHNAAFLAAGVPVFDIRDRFGVTDIVISSAERGAAPPRSSATRRSSCCARTASSPSGRASRRPSSARSSPKSARGCSCRRGARRTDRGARCGGRSAWRTRSTSRPSGDRGSCGSAGCRHE